MINLPKIRDTAPAATALQPSVAPGNQDTAKAHHARAATHYTGMLSQLRADIANRGACAQIAANYLLRAVDEAGRADARLPVVEEWIALAVAELQRGQPC